MDGTDGGVLLRVDLAVSDPDKELGKLAKKAQELQGKLSQTKEALEPATREAETLGIRLDAANARLEEMKSAGTYTAEQLKEQAETVKSLQHQFNGAASNVERMKLSIQKTNSELSATKTRYGEVAKSAQKTTLSVKPLPDMMGRLENRVKRLATRVLIFSVITRGLRLVRDWFADVIKTDKEAMSAIAKLKGALLTLAQPLLSVVIPAFTTLVRILTQVVTSIASVISSLMGTTVEESAKAAEALNEEKKALGGVGSAAKKAAKPLANFDEINRLSFDDGSGAASGAVSDAAVLAPDFSFLDDADEKIRKIADGVLLVGSLLTLWKITGFLGQLAEAIPALGKFLIPLQSIMTLLLGIAMAIAGVILFVKSLKDAWENGVNWLNAAGMVAGLALAVLGLYLAFSVLAPTLAPIVAGIALIVGGVAMMIVAFKDAAENGWNLQNTFLAIAGILATGLGISILVGSWIPLLIAAIGGILLALTVATGHGDELIAGIKDTLQGFKDFFVGIFSGDIEKAIGGIDKIFHGLETSIDAVVDGMRDSILSFLDWLDEKTGGKFHGIIEGVKQYVFDTFDTIKNFFGLKLTAIKEIFVGFVEFLSGIFSQDFDTALQGLLKIVDGFFGMMITPFVTFANAVIDLVNSIIRALNTLHVDIPEWVPALGGKSFGINIPEIPKIKVPKLAQGAVIPPNREFMAVLGDQKRGYNIEAPADLIRQIVREESGGGNYTGLLQQILAAIKEGKVMMVDSTVFGRLIYQANKEESKRVGPGYVSVGRG